MRQNDGQIWRKTFPYERRNVRGCPPHDRGLASVRIRFWIYELRTPELLLELGQTQMGVCRRRITKRALPQHTAAGDAAKLVQAPAAEEGDTREQDRVYWLPLRAELEKLRHTK